MYVIKRDGRQEPVHFDKISARIHNLCYGLDTFVDPVLISQKVCQGVYKGVTTSELDELAAETAAHLTSLHPDFGQLAARIAVSNLHKSTLKSFSETCTLLYEFVQPKTQKRTPLLDERVYQFIQAHAGYLNSLIVYSRDFGYDYFGFKTLQHSYLLKINQKTVERPQHMLMRVACGIHALSSKSDEQKLERIKETYEFLSNRWFTHATPTLFNAGTPFPQLSSCFLFQMFEDSIEGIYETLKSCAMISKQAGGIGLSCHNIRAAGSYIAGTNGLSNGLIPMLRVFNMTARYVDQCFPGDMHVLTQEGPKRFDTLCIGDRVLTDQGEFRPIQAVVRHTYNPKEKEARTPLLSIWATHNPSPVQVTAKHQILAVRGSMPKLKKKKVERVMVDADQLQVGDYLCFPFPKKDLDVSSFTEDDCRFYGLLVAYGSLAHEERGTLVLQKKTLFFENTLTFLCSYFQSHLVDYTQDSKKEEDQVVFTFDAYSKGFKFNQTMLYDSATQQKHIHHKFFYLPSEKLKRLSQGLIENSVEQEKANNLLKVDCTSQHLSQQLKWIFMKVGFQVPFEEEEKRGVYISNATERLNPTDDLLYPDFFMHEEWMYAEILDIQQESQEYKGVLYDLEVEEHHTYVTELGTVHNGGGKRKGAFAMYLEPWHADIFEFLNLKKNHGVEEERARDLFYGLWIPDLFMERVEKDGDWCLMCPHECPGLDETCGKAFQALYESYETSHKYRQKIKARKLWSAILEAQTETGTPYMLFKDAANLKSNQQNLGTIKCSNLCTEIIEYTSPEEVAVCNLASVALPMFVKTSTTGTPEFDFKKLYEVVYVMTRNLNQIIDINYYPIPETKTSNIKHRPIGIGCQGLADVFILMRYPFESLEAQQLNKEIFETMYFAALTCSKDLAKVEGPYSSFWTSPASKGILQFDMWNPAHPPVHSGRWDWSALKQEIQTHGLRNSLLLAPMPTASTSQILGNNECFEPYTSNIYVRRTLAGEFVCVSKHLLRDLMSLGLWTPALKQKIIAHNGSVQNISEIPQHLKDLYKTVWEISQKTLVQMAADRGVYIDQSQSLNIHMTNINHAKLTSLHFFAWKKGLKTGLYYLRSKPATDAIKFTVDPLLVKQQAEETVQFNLFRQNSGTSSSSTSSTLPISSIKSALFQANLGLEVLKSQESVFAQVPPPSKEDTEKHKKEIECSLNNPEACLSCGS